MRYKLLPFHFLFIISIVEAGVYIGASVAGVVFVILVVIIGVVCRKKRYEK